MLTSHHAAGKQPFPCLISQSAKRSPPLAGYLSQAREVQERDGISCEVLDLRTLLPWDADLVEASVRKTGRWAAALQTLLLLQGACA